MKSPVPNQPMQLRHPLKKFSGERGAVWTVLMGLLTFIVFCHVGCLGFAKSPIAQFEDADSLVHTHCSPAGGDKGDGACCPALENLTNRLQTVDTQALPTGFVYVLSPVFSVADAVIVTISAKLFFDTGPPSKLKRSLVTFSLWPNAPPY